MVLSKGRLVGFFIAVLFYTAPVKLIGSLHAAHIYIILLIGFFIPFVKWKGFAVVDLPLVLGVVKFFYDLLFGNVDNDTFFSHAAFIMFSFLFSIGYRISFEKFRSLNNIAVNTFLYFGLAHSVLLVAQFLSFNFLNDFSTLNPYGDFSPYGPDPKSLEPAPYNPMEQSIKRPNGLNWEPSAAGFWTLFNLAIALSLPCVKYKKTMLTIFSVTAVLTFSFLTWVCLVLLYFAGFVLRKDIKFKIFKFYIFWLILLIAISTFGVAFFDVFAIRISEIGSAETSGFIRVVAPVILLFDNFSFLGATYVGDRSYQMLVIFDAAGRNGLSGIANTYFEFLYYYGLAGFFILCLILRWFLVSGFYKGFPYIFTVFLFVPAFGGYVFNSIFMLSFFVFFVFSSLFWFNANMEGS